MPHFVHSEAFHIFRGKFPIIISILKLLINKINISPIEIRINDNPMVNTASYYHTLILQRNPFIWQKLHINNGSIPGQGQPVPVSVYLPHRPLRNHPDRIHGNQWQNQSTDRRATPFRSLPWRTDWRNWLNADWFAQIPTLPL